MSLEAWALSHEPSTKNYLFFIRLYIIGISYQALPLDLPIHIPAPDQEWSCIMSFWSCLFGGVAGEVNYPDDSHWFGIDSHHLYWVAFVFWLYVLSGLCFELAGISDTEGQTTDAAWHKVNPGWARVPWMFSAYFFGIRTCAFDVLVIFFGIICHDQSM